jgi:hypothetical protein
MKYILSFLLYIPLSVLAVGDLCINEHVPDLKNFCMAKQYVNATQCDRIGSLIMKAECMSFIKTKQREVIWAIKPLDLATADIRGEKKFIWNR